MTQSDIYTKDNWPTAYKCCCCGGLIPMGEACPCQKEFNQLLVKALDSVTKARGFIRRAMK